MVGAKRDLNDGEPATDELATDDPAAGRLPAWLPFGRSPRGWLWAGAAVAASLVLLVQQSATDDEAGDLAKLAAEAQPPLADGPMAEAPLDDRAFIARDSGASGRVSVGELPAEERAVAPTPYYAQPREDDRVLGRFSFSPTEDAAIRPPGFAAAESEEVALQPAATPVLFAKVGLRREAIQEGLVTRVLAENAIKVDAAAEPEGFAVVSELGDALRKQSKTRTVDRETYRQSVIDNVRQNFDAGPTDEAESAPNLAAGLAGDAPADDSEVLVIDAPAAQVAGFFEQLRLDTLNCPTLSVEIAEPSNSSRRVVSSSLGPQSGDGDGDGLAAATPPLPAGPAPGAVEQWYFYNRRSARPSASPSRGSRARRMAGPLPTEGQAFRVDRLELGDAAGVFDQPLRQQRFGLDRSRVPGDQRTERQLGVLDGPVAPNAPPTPSAASSVAKPPPARRRINIPPPTDPSARVQALVLVCVDPADTKAKGDGRPSDAQGVAEAVPAIPLPASTPVEPATPLSPPTAESAPEGRR